MCSESKSVWRRLFGPMAAFVLVHLFVLCSPASAAITYTIVQYPQYQVDFTDEVTKYDLIGTITTDGKLGPLTTANILAWQVSSTAENNFISVNWNSTEPSRSVSISGQVIATPTTIEVPRLMKYCRIRRMVCHSTVSFPHRLRACEAALVGVPGR